jgi:hypothetical protein
LRELEMSGSLLCVLERRKNLPGKEDGVVVSW